MTSWSPRITPRRVAGGWIVVALRAAGCGAEPPASAPQLRPVRYEVVDTREREIRRTLAGVAKAGVESRLSFRVGGSVRAVQARLGDRVETGQILARLDPIDFELKVEEAEAGTAQALASLRRAEADYDRIRALYENNNAAKSELDAARAGAESAKAQVDARRKQLQAAQQQLDYSTLRSPADGAIAAVDVEVNENVAAGQGIFLLAAGGRPEVEISVPEGLIRRLSVGQAVRVEFAAVPGRGYDGVVSEVGVAGTGAASTFPVTVRLPEGSSEVRSGMAADVVFRFSDEVDRRITVPAVAVGEDRDGRFVFVVAPEGDGSGAATAHRRSVSTGRPDAGFGRIEILSGLEVGERVVTAGTRRLADGMRVQLPEQLPTEAEK